MIQLQQQSFVCQALIIKSIWWVLDEQNSELQLNHAFLVIIHYYKLLYTDMYSMLATNIQDYKQLSIYIHLCHTSYCYIIFTYSKMISNKMEMK